MIGKMTERYFEYQRGKTDGPRVCADCGRVSGLPPVVPSLTQVRDGEEIRLDLRSGWAARGEDFDSRYLCPECASKKGWAVETE